jgi:hypothetical protein
VTDNSPIPDVLVRLYKTWQENGIWDYQDLTFDRTDEEGRYFLKVEVDECKILRLLVTKVFHRALTYPKDVNGTKIEGTEAVQTINIQLVPVS